MLINLIYVNFWEVFAAGAMDSAPGFELKNGSVTNLYPANQQDLEEEIESQSHGTGSGGSNTPSANSQSSKKTTKISSSKIAEMIKEAAAKWYYIMRLIVIAFMLILLIFIGIKMAISTVASEKAVYKRMIVDWIVGMILVFSIHYIMIFILNVNDSMVEALKPLAQDTTEITDESKFGAEENKKTSSELETTLYESARTRAYSLKFTDGFTGMIIYGVLVYYAWRYTLMYFRRVINIVILTLLAPAVSGSYAFNKVMSGKSKIFSTWLSEFIMNVAVQSVHVIMYTSFVSTALLLSLESLPGVILAIILLNFMVKADGIVRKIFKLSGGKGSLAGDMTDRSTFGDLKKEFKATKDAIMGGDITRRAAKLTYRVATKPVRVGTEMVAGNLMEHFANKEFLAQKANEKNKQNNSNDDSNAEQKQKQKQPLTPAQKDVYEQYKKYRASKGLDEEAASISAELADIQKKLENETDEDKINELMKQVDANEERQEALEERESEIQDEFLKYYHSSGTLEETIKENFSYAFSPEAYTRKITEAEIKRFEELEKLSEAEFKKKCRAGEITRADKKMFEQFKKLKAKDRLEAGYRVRIRSSRVASEDDAFWRRMTGKKTDGIGMRFIQNMKLKNILGISDADEKVLKQMTKFYKQSILGVISSIAGFSLIGANFGLGVGLLANGAASKSEMRRRAANLRNRPAYKNQASYKFKAFSDGTQKSIYEEAMKQMKFAESQMTKKNMEKHPGLADKIMNATITVSGLGLGVSLRPKRLSLTTFEQDKLSGLYEKKLREDFKNMKKQFAYLNTKDLKDDFDETFEKHKKELQKEAEAKSKDALLMQDALSSDNTAVISGQVIQVKDDGEINKFVDRADETDNMSDLTRKQKLSRIKSDIAKNETELIEDSIARICAQKGISNVANLELTDANKLYIKKEILSGLEKRGIVQKGEIVLNDELISSQKIADVHESLVVDEAKKSDVNSKISEKIVQEAILEYMKKNRITDKEILKNSDAKAEIYDIIKERLMSDDSKSSADVIAKISGKDKLKAQTKISDEMIELVGKMPGKVKKHKLSKGEKQLEKLVQRETTRKINETKARLEEGLYTGEKNLNNDRELEMLFTLTEIGRQNKEAEKAGDKSARKERKKQTAAEMDYYMKKDGSKKFNSSRDGSRSFDKQNDGNRDISKVVKDLETRIHGPQDIVDFINKRR